MEVPRRDASARSSRRRRPAFVSWVDYDDNGGGGGQDSVIVQRTLRSTARGAKEHHESDLNFVSPPPNKATVARTTTSRTVGAGSTAVRWQERRSRFGASSAEASLRQHSRGILSSRARESSKTRNDSANTKTAARISRRERQLRRRLKKERLVRQSAEDTIHRLHEQIALLGREYSESLHNSRLTDSISVRESEDRVAEVLRAERLRNRDLLRLLEGDEVLESLRPSARSARAVEPYCRQEQSGRTMTTSTTSSRRVHVPPARRTTALSGSVDWVRPRRISEDLSSARLVDYCSTQSDARLPSPRRDAYCAPRMPSLNTHVKARSPSLPRHSRIDDSFLVDYAGAYTLGGRRGLLEWV